MNNKKIDQKAINNLLNLQEKYISFQNQLLFFEVTPEGAGRRDLQYAYKSNVYR